MGSAVINCEYVIEGGIKHTKRYNKTINSFLEESSRTDEMNVSASIEGEYVGVKAKVSSSYGEMSSNSSKRSAMEENERSEEIEYQGGCKYLFRIVKTSISLGKKQGSSIEKVLEEVYYSGEKCPSTSERKKMALEYMQEEYNSKKRTHTIMISLPEISTEEVHELIKTWENQRDNYSQWISQWPDDKDMNTRGYEICSKILDHLQTIAEDSKKKNVKSITKEVKKNISDYESWLSKGWDPKMNQRGKEEWSKFLQDVRSLTV